MLDTGAGGGSYISVEMWLGLKRRFGLRIDRSSAGALRAANPTDGKVPPMRILGSVPVPVLFANDSRARTIVVRVVEALPYAFILGADFFRTHFNTMDFSPGRGFKPTPSAPWVPFLDDLDKAVEPTSLRHLRSNFASRTSHPQLPSDADTAHRAFALHPEIPSYQDIAWEDTSSLEWDLRPVEQGVSADGFTSVAVETAPVGPMPQDRQLVMVLSASPLDLNASATIGVARAVLWWVPGTPIYCKLVNTGKQGAIVPGSPVLASRSFKCT